MQKEIVINVTDSQHRIALVEDGKLAELFVENDDRERMVGDIYLGKVAKVMPGIRACFIDIGLEQDGFLHFSDIEDRYKDFAKAKHEGDDANASRQGRGKSGGDRNRRKHREFTVSLSKGQEIMVQVFKEPVGTKGVRVTTELALPGRFVVLVPKDNDIGVSRKIADFKEKRRLKRLAHSIIPSGYGCIIRTVASGQDEEILKADMDSLVQTWQEIEHLLRKSSAPSLIHKDMNASSSVIRDLYSEEVTSVVVDSRKMYREFRSYVNMVSPKSVEAISFFTGKEPIFDFYGIEKQIEQSLSRRVWLKSGGYIIVEHTEAMKVIDVNSGRYAAKSEQELNSLKTNIEAVREIARQVRLRDLGGIIVIDFIDMQHDDNKRRVFEEMKREMRKERAKFTILPLTDFGLMQITRQRIRESVQLSTSDICPTCNGTARVTSQSAIYIQIERWLRRFRLHSKDLRLVLHIHPNLAAYLLDGNFSRLTKLMVKYFVQVKVNQDPTLAVDEFIFFSRKRNQNITNQFLSAKN
jgi:ribonuclease G